MRDGNGYRISGSKIYITNGIIANLVLLAAKTQPDGGAKGISLFIVDTTTPGFRRGRKLKKVGNHAQDTAELFFDDMHVPADSLLGEEENRGWAQLMNGLRKNEWWSPSVQSRWRGRPLNIRLNTCASAGVGKADRQSAEYTFQTRRNRHRYRCWAAVC